MKNCHVVSAQGWGPGCSGAYCTFRINRRAEFLRSSRRQQVHCAWQRQEFCTHVLMLRKSTDKWNKAEQATLVHYWTFWPSLRENSWRQTHVFYYLLWILSSTFSVEKAFTSKSTPQLCQRERNQCNEPRTSADVQTSSCTLETGRFLPTANSSGLQPL